MTPTPFQGPPIPQGGGGLMGYDHDHGRGGGGGDPEPGTYIHLTQLEFGLIIQMTLNYEFMVANCSEVLTTDFAVR